MTFELPLRTRSPDGSTRHEGLAFDQGVVIDGPLVSCLMVSRGDLFPAEHAIRCYREQSYANRELVIVTAARGSAVGLLVAALQDPSIRYVEIAAPTLGELRNASVAHARGSLIAHWDDDDLHHPDRLAVQIAAITTTGAKACFLERILLWWPARRLLKTGHARMWEGSMIAQRAIVPVYPALPREEDLFVADAIARLHRITALDWARGYCYAVHGANTNQPPHFDYLFGEATPIEGAEDYDAAMTLIGGFMPIRNYAAGLEGR